MKKIVLGLLWTLLLSACGNNTGSNSKSEVKQINHHCGYNDVCGMSLTQVGGGSALRSSNLMAMSKLNVVRNGRILPMFTDSFLVINMFECKFDNKRFVIEEDEAVGFYLYILNFGEENPYADYLQDTLEDAKEFASEEFQVPLNGWVQISGN